MTSSPRQSFASGTTNEILHASFLKMECERSGLETKKIEEEREKIKLETDHIRLKIKLEMEQETRNKILYESVLNMKRESSRLKSKKIEEEMEKIKVETEHIRLKNALIGLKMTQTKTDIYQQQQMMFVCDHGPTTMVWY